MACNGRTPPCPLDGHWCVHWLDTAVSSGWTPACPVGGGPWTGTTMSPGWTSVCPLDNGSLDTALSPGWRPTCPLNGHHHVLWMDTGVSPGASHVPSQRTPQADAPRPLAEGTPGGHCHVPGQVVPKPGRYPQDPKGTLPCPRLPMGPGESPFFHRLPSLAECPAIVPRCMWGARPYRGTPKLLTLPLGSVYIHHTFIPSTPCRTFAACADAMRSMQRFHQDTRGWDDIGYR